MQYQLQFIAFHTILDRHWESLIQFSGLFMKVFSETKRDFLLVAVGELINPFHTSPTKAYRHQRAHLCRHPQ